MKTDNEFVFPPQWENWKDELGNRTDQPAMLFEPSIPLGDILPQLVESSTSNMAIIVTRKGLPQYVVHRGQVYRLTVERQG